MSCCTIKQNTSSSAKHYDLVKKHFDSAEVIRYEKYQQLTLKDKAPATSNMDWVVWLDIKIAHQAKNENYRKKEMELLDEVCQKLYDWLDLLRMPEEENKGVQLSLFGDEFEVDEEEKMPSQPTDSSDGSWGRYHNECKRVNKNRLKKNNTFFELFNIRFYEYTGIDHRLKLPTIEEFKDIYRQIILNPVEGRFENYWLDSLKYLTAPSSDVELISRLKGTIRVFLVPFKKYYTAFYGIDYGHTNNDSKDDRIAYRFYTSGKDVTSTWDLDYDKCSDFPNYGEIFEDASFIAWIRDTLNIPYIEAINDEDALKENIKSYFNGMLWCKKEEYDWMSKIKTFRNHNEFYANFKAFLKANKIDSNGGGSGYSGDGYSGSIWRDKDGHIEVKQKIEARHMLNRPCEGLEIDSHYGYYTICEVKGKDIYKKAYELFAKSGYRELSLFDFLLDEAA